MISGSREPVLPHAVFSLIANGWRASPDAEPYYSLDRSDYVSMSATRATGRLCWSGSFVRRWTRHPGTAGRHVRAGQSRRKTAPCRVDGGDRSPRTDLRLAGCLRPDHGTSGQSHVGVCCGRLRAALDWIPVARCRSRTASRLECRVARRRMFRSRPHVAVRFSWPSASALVTL